MRSDRTLLCARCRLRFARAQGPACPVCVRPDSVHDGRTSAGDERVGRILARRPRGHRGWIGLEGARPGSGGRRRGFLVLGAVLAVGFVIPLVTDHLGISPMLPMSLLLGTVATWIGLRSVIGLATAPPRARIGLAMHTPMPAARAPEAKRVRGRVRVLEPTTAPVSGARVAAFRITGQAFGGEIDDAGGGVIEVEPDDGGTPIRVDLSSATIALEVDDRETEIAKNEALDDFLEARWLYPDRGPVRVAEARLEDGDAIELDAVISSETAPEGYRQTRVAQVAEDRADTGTIVRAVRRVI